MTESTAIEPRTSTLEPSSIHLNPDHVSQTSGAGKAALTESDDVSSVLETELARLRAEDEKAEKPDAKEPVDKDKPEVKDEKAPKEEEKPAKPRAEDGKFAKADKAEDQQQAKAQEGEPAKAAQQEAPERRPSEGQHREPPARFMPEARAKWANVPNEVKAEFHRVSAEMDRENQQYRASHDRYSQLREFDDLARTNGRDLRESLVKVNEVENAMQRNPVAGLDAVLRELGPRKSDGSPLTIMDVAQFLTQNPNAYQPQMATAQPQAQQANPEVEQLKAIVLDMQAQQRNQTVVPLIETFAADKPDFGDLQERILTILNEGVIDKLYGAGLSLEQKLSEAYRMAGGQGPSSRPDAEAALAHSTPQTNQRPVNPDAGTKSVRGAPADGAHPATEDDQDEDLAETLRKEGRRLKAFS